MPAATVAPLNQDALFANTLTIDELAGKQRTIHLRGAGLPFQDSPWPVKQSVATTYYVGNPEASQQALGGQILSSEWEGEWKRTLLGKSQCKLGAMGGVGELVVDPETLVKAFESICLDGMRVKVTWRNKTREGRLTEFTPSYGRSTNVKWRAKFDWVSRGHAVDRRVQGIRSSGVGGSLDEAAAVAEVGANMQTSFVDVGTGTKRVPKGMPTLTLGQIGMMLDAPNKLLNNFCRQARLFAKNAQQIGQLINQARGLPARLVNTALSETENMMAIANNTVDSLSRVSPENLAIKRNAAAVLQSARYYGAATRQATYLADKTASVRETLRVVSADAYGTGTTPAGTSPATRDVLAIHVVHQGETLPSISARYYETPDNAYVIARANHLQYPCPPDNNGYTIGGKRMLVIPVLDRQVTNG